MLACTVLHNYIYIVDPYDKFNLQEVIILEEQSDIVDEDDENIVNFSNTMTRRRQVEREVNESKRETS